MTIAIAHVSHQLYQKYEWEKNSIFLSWNSVKQKDGKNQERESKYYTVITKKGF